MAVVCCQTQSHADLELCNVNLYDKLFDCIFELSYKRFNSFYVNFNINLKLELLVVDSLRHLLLKTPHYAYSEASTAGTE